MTRGRPVCGLVAVYSRRMLDIRQRKEPFMDIADTDASNGFVLSRVLPNVGAALTGRAEALIGVERMLDALESSLADLRR
jgi:hypothetical protein